MYFFGVYSTLRSTLECFIGQFTRTKCKAVPLHAMEATKDSRHTAPFTRNLGNRCSGQLHALASLAPWKEPLIPSE